MKRLPCTGFNLALAALSGLLALVMVGCGSLGNQGGAASTGTSTAPGDRSPAASMDSIRVGDPLLIEFSGAADAPPKVVERLKEDGLIHLPFLRDSIKAVGKTRSELEQEIQKAYVPAFYRRLTVKVAVEGRFFTVAGEVRMPNRYTYLGEMTILQAIAAAGDFTDFAARSRVEVIRAGNKPIRVDCNAAARDASKNIPIFPDDYIKIPRRVFFD